MHGTCHAFSMITTKMSWLHDKMRTIYLFPLIVIWNVAPFRSLKYILGRIRGCDFLSILLKGRLQIWTQLDSEPGGFRSRWMADTPSCVSNLIYDHNSV